MGRRTDPNPPAFWLVIAMVFVANAVMSTAFGEWALGGLQLLTGGLALAAGVIGAGRQGGTRSPERVR